jgi:hypothetical protein
MHPHVNRGWRLLVVAAAFTLLVQGRAGATPLNLGEGTPDITANFLDFAFDSEGGLCGGADNTLCISSDEAWLSSIGLSPEIDGSVPVAYTLGANVAADGTLTPGGTFVMGDYLTGTVTQFGYATEPGVTVLEFIVTLYGGTLWPQFGPRLGVIAALYDWTAFDDYASAGSLQTDNFAVPDVAGSLSLLALGLVGLAATRLRLGKGNRR